MFNLCLSFNELQPDACKRYAYKKEFKGFFMAKKIVECKFSNE